MNLQTHDEIANRMIAECLDYHEFPNGQLLVVEPNGVWLTDAECKPIQRVTVKTWMLQGINF